MSLFINQGRQDTSSDNTFEVMISEEEIAQIIKIEMDKEWPDTLDVTGKIISEGKYKGRNFFDKVSFAASSPFSWKYRNLRKAAGCPYTEGEPVQIDIESLLLNKAIKVELGIRKGKDGGEYQNIKYKAQSATAPKTTVAPVVETQDTVELSADEDLPW